MSERMIISMAGEHDRKVIRLLAKSGPINEADFDLHGLGVFWMIRRGVVNYRRKWIFWGPKMLSLTPLGKRAAKLIEDQKPMNLVGELK